MTFSSHDAQTFYRDVAKNRLLWTIADEVGYPAPKGSAGQRAIPFWSSLSRAKRIIDIASAYSDFEPEEVSWENFVREWVPDMIKDGYLVGVNCAGQRVVGYDIEPERIIKNVETYINMGSNE